MKSNRSKFNYALRITHFALVNPTPPTPPTPPAPPTLDKGDGAGNHAKIDAKKLFQMPFQKNSEEVEEVSESVEENSQAEENSLPGTRQVTTPETMARDAVANGGGALTKKTVERPQEKNSQENQQTPQLPPSLNFAMTEEDRGKEVLKEFQREENISENENQTLTEQPRTVKLNSQEEHGGVYWILTLIFALALGVLFVKKFLLTDKPKLKKSDLFEGTGERLKQTKEKFLKPTKNYQPPKPSPPIKKVQPAKLPPKEEEDKGKHFEVRI